MKLFYWCDDVYKNLLRDFNFSHTAISNISLYGFMNNMHLGYACMLDLDKVGDNALISSSYYYFHVEVILFAIFCP